MPKPGDYLKKLLNTGVTRKLLQVLLIKMQGQLERAEVDRETGKAHRLRGKMQNPRIYREQVEKLLGMAREITQEETINFLWF